MAGKRWYSSGLRFECTQCGDCCTGAPGHVWVDAEEIAALAAAVGEEDVEEFERKFVRRVGARKSLKELPQADYDCIFLDSTTRRCLVYDARPKQCRTWPFWDSNLKTPEDWENAAEVCPGCNKGRLYEIEKIETQRKIVKV
jgi:Fe-S-cluster containining protein